MALRAGWDASFSLPAILTEKEKKLYTGKKRLRYNIG